MEYEARPRLEPARRASADTVSRRAAAPVDLRPEAAARRALVQAMRAGTTPVERGPEDVAPRDSLSRLPAWRDPASVQRKLLVGSKWKKCGPLTQESENSWSKFLEEDNIVNCFYPDEELVLRGQYDQVVLASQDHRSKNNAASGNALHRLYNALVREARGKSVASGSEHWDDLMVAAADVIAPQPSGKFIQKNAKDAAALVWPVALLGAVPDTFWKAVLAAAKPKPVLAAPKVIPASVTDVLLHAQARYVAWVSGVEWNRGAWAGSDAHGAQPDDYESVAPTTITALQAALPHDGWRLTTNSQSAAEQNSLHKYGGAAKGQDFIYHL